MKKYKFRIHLDYHTVRAYYQGQISTVLVTSDNGLKVQMPLNALRSHFTQSGLDGYFEAQVSDKGKLIQLNRIN